MEAKVLMLIWTIVTTGNANFGANPIAVTQTTTEVTSAVCEEVKQMANQVKLPGPNQKMEITVKCIPISKK